MVTTNMHLFVAITDMKPQSTLISVRNTIKQCLVTTILSPLLSAVSLHMPKHPPGLGNSLPTASAVSPPYAKTSPGLGNSLLTASGKEQDITHTGYDQSSFGFDRTSSAGDYKIGANLSENTSTAHGRYELNNADNIQRRSVN